MQTSTLISFRDESKYEERQHTLNQRLPLMAVGGVILRKGIHGGGGRGGLYHGNQTPWFAQDEGVQDAG